MIQRLLLAIDGSESSDAAQNAAISIAAAHHARVTGFGIIDTPWITRPQALPIGGSAYKAAGEVDHLRAAHQRLSAASKRFSAAAAERPITAATLTKEGDPVSLLAEESVAHDLIVIGRATDFRYMSEEEASPTVARLVRDNPRPVLLAPTGPRTLDRVIVAFDGSLPASRALHIYALLGLAAGARVQVVSVSEDVKGAEDYARRAIDLLEAHGAHAEPVALRMHAHPADIILSHSEAWRAGLIVMGAFGHRGLQEMIFGSCTRRLLKESPTALFVHH